VWRQNAQILLKFNESHVNDANQKLRATVGARPKRLPELKKILAFIQNSEVPPRQQRRRDAHDLWLAVRAAHNRCQTASAALTAIGASIPEDSHDSHPDVPLDEAAEEHRKAFDEYIEASLRLSAFMLSEDEPKIPAPSSAGARLRWTKPHPVMLALALLFPLLMFPLLGLISLRRDEKQIRDLDSIRDAVNRMSEQTRNQTQASSTQPLSNVAPLAKGQAAPVPAAAASATTTGRHPVAAQGKTNDRSLRPGRGAPSHAGGGGEYRESFEFKLTPSPHFDRVGPILLSLRNVDLRRQDVDLSVMADHLRIDTQAVKLYQPVWIPLKRPVLVIIQRIDQRQVRGSITLGKQRGFRS
jgi:hypothetical protein